MLKSNDEFWMNRALEQAQLAYEINEVPVGAVVVLDGDIKSCIGRGHNKSISTNDPCAHAEVVAIRDAAQYVSNYRLANTTIYVTLEPCLMCIGAIIHARIERVIFAASDPKTGVLGSKLDCCTLDFINHVPKVVSGVLQSEASTLLKKFFQEKRSNKK
ncbi:MAG: tRNA adenosine(34) deaminase TadA [Francisellaceae bacterium]|jgi:tRNA(adenine34) deaminase|nr:tRNA adenosine(34) deaminase TadA [Francisellaceae bacterium]MBT6207523.1 tRNA adenosine(34) deaminase TadA [Francisellaceae bacterium]MBT6539200.1 tRNA adenosine(34) deaminase TadA [Francisellaceae bacterium]